MSQIVEIPRPVVKDPKTPLADVKVFIIGPYITEDETLAQYYNRAFNKLGAITAGFDDRVDAEKTLPYWGDKKATLKPDVLLVLKGNIREDMAEQTKVRMHNAQNFDMKTVLYWPDQLADFTSIYGRADFAEANGRERQNNFEFLKDVMEKKYYDHLFMAMWYDNETLDKIHAKFLPIACDTTVHFESVSEQPTRNGIFVGSFKPGREFITTLKPQVDIYGNGWGRFVSTKDVYNTDKRIAICRGKMVINQHVFGVGPNDRLFQTGGYRRAIITDVFPGIQELGLHNGVHYAGYISPEQCQEEYTYLLEHDKERERLANELQKLVLARHTYEHRALEMMKEVGIL